MRQIDDGVMGLPPKSITSTPTRIASAAPTAVAAVPNQVVGGLHRVSEQSGVSFRYLLAQAVSESGGESTARNRMSSASGLFQFTRGTWLHMLKDYGAEHGLAALSSQIKTDGKGGHVVDDPALMKQAMALRNDPDLSTQMAAHLAKENGGILEKALGRPATDTDLYIAHFLGAAGATKILKAYTHNPNQPAAALFPTAASHNRSIFFTPDHKARSVGAVYDHIVRVLDSRARDYLAMINDHGMSQGAGRATPTGVDLSHSKIAYYPVSRIATRVETPEDSMEMAPQPTPLAQISDAVKHTQAYVLASRLVHSLIAEP